jgi:NAD(P)H-nitrite reductase large subunit
MSDDRDNYEGLHPAIRGLKTVCRCNNVKYKTLERVVLAGAHTIKDVAAKTTATTGYCGGSCTPYIQKMIDRILGVAGEEPVATTTADDENAWWIRKPEAK